MTQIIEIEGAVARLISREVLTEVELDALEPFLTYQKPTVSPIMPAGTVASYLDPTNNAYQILVERPPRTEPVRLQLLHPDAGMKAVYAERMGYGSADEMPEAIMLPLPWEYFHFRGTIQPSTGPGSVDYYIVRDTYLYWSPKRLDHWGQQLHFAKLPNTGEGLICWGHAVDTNANTMADKLTSLIEAFYITPFNEDWGGQMNFPVLPAKVGDIKVDDFGIPNYNWSSLREVILDWPNNILGEPQAPLEADIPESFAVVAVKEWIETLSPRRRQFIQDVLNGTA